MLVGANNINGLDQRSAVAVGIVVLINVRFASFERVMGCVHAFFCAFLYVIKFVYYYEL